MRDARRSTRTQEIHSTGPDYAELRVTAERSQRRCCRARTMRYAIAPRPRPSVRTQRPHRLRPLRSADHESTRATHVAYRRTRERKSGCSRRRNFGRFGQRVEKARAPPVHIGLAHDRHQRVVALAALVERHRECALNRLRGALRVVRIDEQRGLQLLGCAGEARQHEHAGIGLVLRGKKLLRDQVHPVTQRRNERDTACAIEAGQALARDGPMNVAHRHPLELAVVAVDCTAQAVHLAPQVVVGAEILAARRGDLDQRRAVAILRILFEQLTERMHALRQALRVIETVDADQQLAARIFIAHPLEHVDAVAILRQRRELVDVDADRKRAGRQRPAERTQATVGQARGAGLGLDVVLEVQQIGFGLKADEVVREQRAHQPFVLRNRGHDRRRRHRNMQEEADRIRAAHRAQFGGERNQLIVVNPDGVVRPQQRAELAREQLVHASVAVGEAAVELREIEPVVEHRPEHVVRVAEVVRVVILRIEIDRRELDAADVLDLHVVALRGSLALAAQPAAPAEPDAARFLQAVFHGYGKAAGGGFTGICNAIGYDDESAHQLSCEWLGKVRAARARGGRRHRREARWGRSTLGRESGACDSPSERGVLFKHTRHSPDLKVRGRVGRNGARSQ
ncbi:hypothetical protein BVI434_410017 [Burkholderia vietnamiensis]|nr:hypothetical protein BVI434_410017 [Burkholderia vietnamiensis]